jgi:hypothetical protein
MNLLERILTAPRFSLFAALLAFSLVGCRPGNSVSFEAAGHSVSASIRGKHVLKTTPDRAVLEGDFGRVTIERSRVQVDDGQWVKIPTDTSIRLEASPRKIQLAAGNVTTMRSR